VWFLIELLARTPTDPCSC